MASAAIVLATGRWRRYGLGPMRRIHADLLLVLAAAIWGLAFVFQKTAMSHIGPLLFVGVRATVAMLALAPWAVREGLRDGRMWPPGLARIAALAGLAFFAGAALQQTGIVTATVTNAGFLTALYVVVTPFIVWLVKGRAPVWIVWPAVVMSFVGTWLLGGGTLDAFSRGDLLIALSALFWAGHVVVVGAASRHSRPVTFTAVQFAVVGVLGLAGAFATESISFDAIRKAWFQIAYVGLLSSALTFTLLAIALKHTPPAEAAVIVSTETLFAAFAAFVLLGERLSWIGWAGAALILLAALLVQLGPQLAVRRQGSAAVTADPTGSETR